MTTATANDGLRLKPSQRRNNRCPNLIRSDARPLIFSSPNLALRGKIGTQNG